MGHEPGMDWPVQKKEHEAKGSTRKEVIEAENNFPVVGVSKAAPTTTFGIDNE